MEKIFFLSLCLLVMASCSHQPETVQSDTVSSSYVGESVNLDAMPESPLLYMQQLADSGAITLLVDDNDESVNLKDSVWSAIRELDQYAKGERKYYPADNIRKALDHIAFALGCSYGHGGFDTESGGVSTTAFPEELFFFRLLELAAYYSPQIDFVTDFHSADGEAGILNFHEWSPNPMYSFLVYKTDKGHRVAMVGKPLECEISKLFRLSDSEGRVYYLCSNNGEEPEFPEKYNTQFTQYLFLKEGDKVRLVAQFKPEYDKTHFGVQLEDVGGKSPIVRFNPSTLQWSYCTKEGDIFHPIKNSPLLTLSLNGTESCFDELWNL